MGVKYAEPSAWELCIICGGNKNLTSFVSIPYYCKLKGKVSERRQLRKKLRDAWLAWRGVKTWEPPVKGVLDLAFYICEECMVKGVEIEARIKEK